MLLNYLILHQHRIVASGVDIPCGMKNPTGGDLSVMMNAISAAQVKQKRGNPVGADAGNAAEDERLHDAGKQGRQENPRRTKDGLLIAHHEIPFGEQVD